MSKDELIQELLLTRIQDGMRIMELDEQLKSTCTEAPKYPAQLAFGLLELMVKHHSAVPDAPPEVVLNMARDILARRVTKMAADSELEEQMKNDTGRVEMFIDKTDEYDMRDQPTPASAPVDADLIQRMLDAWFQYPWGEGGLEFQPKRMTAALRLAEAARDAKWERAIREAYDAGEIDIFRNFQQSIENIRARLLAPAKTVDERVWIAARASDGLWEVWEDGCYCGAHDERTAKALRLGLIATLKQESK